MRQRIVLATKVGMDMGDGRKGLRPEWIRQAVDDSLRRLQTDHIDLYQAHTDDAETPLEDTLGAFADLIRPARCAPSAPATTARRGCSRRWTPARGWACRATRRCSRCST
jgi:hypothetical protein